MQWHRWNMCSMPWWDRVTRRSKRVREKQYWPPLHIPCISYFYLIKCGRCFWCLWCKWVLNSILSNHLWPASRAIVGGSSNALYPGCHAFWHLEGWLGKTSLIDPCELLPSFQSLMDQGFEYMGCLHTFNIFSCKTAPNKRKTAGMGWPWSCIKKRFKLNAVLQLKWQQITIVFSWVWQMHALVDKYLP